MNVNHWYLSDISSSWPSFIHITWTLASDTSHSKVALFFSVIFRSFSCLVNSMTRAAAKGKNTPATFFTELDYGADVLRPDVVKKKTQVQFITSIAVHHRQYLSHAPAPPSGQSSSALIKADDGLCSSGHHPYLFIMYLALMPQLK